MVERDVDVLFEGGGFFEGPRWRDGAWWVSDFYRHQVATYAPDGTETVVATVDAQPSGLGWMPDGTLLVVSMKDHRVLRVAADGTTSVHADIAPFCGGHANDMVVDRHGHAFVGNFGFDLMAGETPAGAALVRVDPDGTVAVAAEDLRFPNGTVITPDGATLVVGETMGNGFVAFDLADDGTLSNRRDWARFGRVPSGDDVGAALAAIDVAPDGCTLDAEGHIWAADALADRAVRIAPGGTIVEELRVPGDLGVYACQLGGADGRTLLLCAAPDYFEQNRSAAREAVLFTTVVDVPHAGLP